MIIMSNRPDIKLRLFEIERIHPAVCYMCCDEKERNISPIQRYTICSNCKSVIIIIACMAVISFLYGPHRELNFKSSGYEIAIEWSSYALEDVGTIITSLFELKFTAALIYASTLYVRTIPTLLIFSLCAALRNDSQKGKTTPILDLIGLILGISLVVVFGNLEKKRNLPSLHSAKKEEEEKKPTKSRKRKNKKIKK